MTEPRRGGEYPVAVSETVPAPNLVIDDEDIFAAHQGGSCPWS